jgi:DNA-binding NarL/FixJ family response regulator
MLALIIAHPGAVRDGLVALLEAAPEISKILQVKKVKPAWDFVQVIQPNIILIYTISITPELAAFIAKLVGDRISPILVIVESEEDRHTAVSQGADVAVMAGLPPAKLRIHITTLLYKDSETRKSRLLEGDIK